MLVHSSGPPDAASTSASAIRPASRHALTAASGGPELWTSTRDRYLQSAATPFMSTLAAVVHQDFAAYVASSDLANWKETLALLNTYAAPEELSTLCNQLGERLSDEPAAATLCYICLLYTSPSPRDS